MPPLPRNSRSYFLGLLTTMNHHDPETFLGGMALGGPVPLDSQIRGATGSFGAGTHLGGDGATATGTGVVD